MSLNARRDDALLMNASDICLYIFMEEQIL
jgi:hypothetical protein